VLQELFLKPLALFAAAASAGLGAPTANVVPSESQVLVSWEAPTQAINGVLIEESVDNGNTWTTVSKLPPTSTHLRVQGLTDGKNYWFRVSWIWPDYSIGIPSATLVAIPINNPSAPTGLIATANDTQVALNWDQTTESSVTGYEIEQSTDGGNTWKVISKNTGSVASGYLVDKLTTGTTYTYRIKALAFGGGQSEYSDSAVVKLAAAPTGAFALNYAIKKTKITLTWDTPIDLQDITDYKVNMSSDGGLNWFVVATTPGGINTAIVPYIIGGATYQVIADSSSGQTASSAVQLVQTNAIPDPKTTATLNPTPATTDSATPTPSATDPASPTPTPTPTSSLTPATTKSSKLPIIPIAGVLLALIIGISIFVSSRNNNSRKRPKRRPRPNRNPTRRPPTRTASSSATRSTTSSANRISTAPSPQLTQQRASSGAAEKQKKGKKDDKGKKKKKK